MGIFRYPGGKSRLLEPIKEYLYPIIKDTNSFADVFVGGGSVLIQVAKDFPNIDLYANDLDVTIYSFWKLFQNNHQADFENFYKLIKQKPNVKMFYKMRNDGIPNGLVNRAYFGVFFNRCAFSGIQNSGCIGGIEQKSKYKIDCRYNSKRIIEECEELRILFKNRLIVSDEDMSDFITRIPSVGIYCDPPYYVKGKELYPVFMTSSEHGDLSNILHDRTNWLLSIDICPEVDELYKWAKKIPLDARYSIRDKKKAWTPKKEYLIMSKLLKT